MKRGLSPFRNSIPDSQDSYLGRSFGCVGEDKVVYRRAKKTERTSTYHDYGGIHGDGLSHQVYCEGYVSIVVVADDSKGLEVYQ